MPADPNPNPAPAPQPEPTPKPEPAPAEPPVKSLLDPDKPDPAKPDDPLRAPVTDPTKYTDFAVPEGWEIDPAELGPARELFAQHGMSQAAAQDMVNFHVAQLQKVADQPYQLWSETQKKWQDEVNADKELGGKNLPEVKATIAKAFDRFGDPKVLEALSMTGAGNNPAIIRTLFKMAKALTEGSHVPGAPPKAAPKSMAEAMYPDLPNKG